MTLSESQHKTGTVSISCGSSEAAPASGAFMVVAVNEGFSMYVLDSLLDGIVFTGYIHHKTEKVEPQRWRPLMLVPSPATDQ